MGSQMQNYISQEATGPQSNFHTKFLSVKGFVAN